MFLCVSFLVVELCPDDTCFILYDIFAVIDVLLTTLTTY